MTIFSDYAHITSRCFVNAPLGQLDEGLLDFFLANRLQPEIGLNDRAIDFIPPHRLGLIAQALFNAGLGCTLHAPFSGLDPTAQSADDSAHAYAAIQKAFALIPLFRPQSIVCHPHLVGEPTEAVQQHQVAISVGFWQEFLCHAHQHGTPVMFENTYETTPSWHCALFDALDSPTARFCLDMGHVTAFAKNKWQDWIPLFPRLGQVHLHDNHGDTDEHLGVGQGTIDFAGFFAFLQKNAIQPLITLEPHYDDGLVASLETLSLLDFFHTR